MESSNIKIKINGKIFKNPIITASGTFGYGEEYNNLVDLEKLGGICVKGISLKPWEGNPEPRIIETPSGMLNSIGLQNVGVDNFIKEKIPFLEKINTNIIVNVVGKTENEYVEVCKILDSVDRVDFIELNLSCPNIKKGGIQFGSSEKKIFSIVSKIKKIVKKPLWVKLSPNFGNIKPFAKASEDAGADGISLINTLIGMKIDTQKMKPFLPTVTGGLSGPAIRPIAIKMVWDAFQEVKIPIIGMGGVTNLNDALEFIMAGASLVGVGTYNFINPTVTIEIIEGLEKYVKIKRTDYRKLIGIANEKRV